LSDTDTRLTNRLRSTPSPISSYSELAARCAAAPSPYYDLIAGGSEAFMIVAACAARAGPKAAILVSEAERLAFLRERCVADAAARIKRGAAAGWPTDIDRRVNGLAQAYLRLLSALCEPPPSDGPDEARSEFHRDLGERLVAFQEAREAVECLAVLAEPTPLFTPRAPAGEPIYSLGERRYRIGGGGPFSVDQAEDVVLQAFVGAPALQLDELEQRTRSITHPERVLRRLQEKLPGAAIFLPGGKSKGGYRADVQRPEGVGAKVGANGEQIPCKPAERPPRMGA
jgi:hypothetical protein